MKRRRVPAEKWTYHIIGRALLCTKQNCKSRLFDHLVGEREQFCRDFQAERLSGFAIKDEFELIYLLNRQLSRFNALKNSPHVNAAFVIAIPEHRSIAH